MYLIFSPWWADNLWWLRGCYWAAVALSFWYLAFKVKPAGNVFGSVMAAIILGWLLWIPIVLVMMFGPIRYWRLVRFPFH